MNNLYPAYLKLEGRRVLVVGGGKVAEQKIKGLLDCGADVTVVSPFVTSRIEGLSVNGNIHVARREYHSGDTDGFMIVIGTTNDPEVQEQIYAEACERRIPVNVVDNPDLCTFYLGSVFQQGDLKVAVSTNGKSPTIGEKIRDRIAAEFSDGYPEALERIGRIREDVHKNFRDYESRKRILEQYVNSELELVERKKEDRDRKPETGRRKKEVRSDRTKGVDSGKVYLIGAGPGDPELITLKALRILRSAEVILYDALVGNEILAEAPGAAEKIYVGKRAGAHCVKQSEINAILIEKAGEGKRVVRLKGGDPFIFGRGGEEMETLLESGIEVEVVPGITAGIGVPTSLGLPLTHRREASSVLFLTGHEDPSKPGERVDWEAVSHVDTIVIYMGTRNLPSIVERLIRTGVPSSKPVAVIFGGTIAHEKVVTGTLHDICGRVGEMPPGLPGLIVVGETVRVLAREALPYEMNDFAFSGRERISYVE